MTTTLPQITSEVRRVFGNATVEQDTSETVRVLVDGWPDAVAYRGDLLMEVLGRFPDGHGTTEEGDAEVCHATNAAGAFLGFVSVE